MAMVNAAPEIATLEDLRGFVHQTICDRQQLLFGAFRFQEKILVRSGKPCGLHFILFGPRSVQFAAIWDASCHTILFFDGNGGRFQRIDLTASAGFQEELADLAEMSGKMAACEKTGGIRSISIIGLGQQFFA